MKNIWNDPRSLFNGNHFSSIFMVRAISVYSAGVPYAARFTAAVKILLPWLRFSSRIRFDRKLSESYYVGLWIKQRVLIYRRNA